MLDRISPKPVTPPKDSANKKVGLSTSVCQHTYDFILAEARARNMGASEFLREICERLESGEF